MILWPFSLRRSTHIYNSDISEDLSAPIEPAAAYVENKYPYCWRLSDLDLVIMVICSFSRAEASSSIEVNAEAKKMEMADLFQYKVHTLSKKEVLLSLL